MPGEAGRAKIGIIGGTGLTALTGLEAAEKAAVTTPYGAPSAELSCGTFAGARIVFLPRHGTRRQIPPHRVNYRANIWAMREIGVDHLIAVASVGGIHPQLEPGQLVIPDQIIDYTWAREHTLFDDGLDEVVHIDFTSPYCERLRKVLIAAAREAQLGAWETGTYAATQGPRLETAAEIDRLERDGCHIVGMTGMPEASLAREAGLGYAACAVVANAAAGRGQGAIRMEDIEANLRSGMQGVVALLASALPALV